METAGLSRQVTDAQKPVMSMQNTGRSRDMQADEIPHRFLKGKKMKISLSHISSQTVVVLLVSLLLCLSVSLAILLNINRIERLTMESLIAEKSARQDGVSKKTIEKIKKDILGV